MKKKKKKSWLNRLMKKLLIFLNDFCFCFIVVVFRLAVKKKDEQACSVDERTRHGAL